MYIKLYKIREIIRVINTNIFLDLIKSKQVSLLLQLKKNVSFYVTMHGSFYPPPFCDRRSEDACYSSSLFFVFSRSVSSS